MEPFFNSLLDPPYFSQGRRLYYDYYKSEDHAAVADMMKTKMNDRFWIVSYDNAAQICKLYSEFRSIVYSVGYSARDTRTGKEVMFFSPKMVIPDLVGPVQRIGKIRGAAKFVSEKWSEGPSKQTAG